VSIKSDKWIRRLADSYRMIDPFEAQQVKQNAKGKLISYAFCFTCCASKGSIMP
jgi:dCTP deaminase